MGLRGRPVSGSSDGLWPAVDRLLDHMDVRTVLAHHVAPLAADRWSATGRKVPALVEHQGRAAQLMPLIAVGVITKARAAYPGRMLVLKGPEIAALYPSHGRVYADLDVLVDDAPAALQALLAAGFEPVDARLEQRPHHLPPVWWPGAYLPLELHTALNWPRHLRAPRADEIFADAVPSSLGIEGLETPAPAHQAILTAAHSWKHLPLRSLRDLIDITLLADHADPAEVERVARRWDMARIWRTTAAASDWLFEDGRRPLATRLWAQSLRRPREATVLERHLRRWVTPFWALPFPRASIAAAKNVYTDLQPVKGEGWPTKLHRSILVASHPTRTRSELDRQDELDF